MSKLKRPREISAFVERAFRQPPKKVVLALDIPSGTGRHSAFLSELGFDVVAADINAAALGEIRRNKIRAQCVQLNAELPLPFKSSTFDVAVVVHPERLELLARLGEVVRPGGLLVLETFGAQGGNWKSLPAPGEIANRLVRNWTTISLLEATVRAHPSVVVSKGIFQRAE